LRHDLTHMLKKKFRYTDGDISKLLGGLQDAGFIVRTALSTQERAAIFGGRGDTRVVVLKDSGHNKIEEFKNDSQPSGELALRSACVDAKDCPRFSSDGGKLRSLAGQTL
jgi:hypothetical protein